jgi:hypothetical protein
LNDVAVAQVLVVVATDNNERKVPPVGFEPTLYGF